MSCILTIIGQDFDVDTFIEKSKLRPYKKSYKGQPRVKSKPDGIKLSHSLLSIETSKAGFNDLKKQISDTFRFLSFNKDKLTFITSTEGIDHAIIDFGIYLRIDSVSVLTQSDKFPNKLLKLAGELGLDIELSIYPVDMQTILENQNNKKK